MEQNTEMYTLLGKYSLRPEQLTTLERIESEFGKGKSTVLLNAPTGSGKSVIAMHLASRYPRTLITTCSIQLGEQYVRDFGRIATHMRGRSNFMCSLATDLRCDEGPCIGVDGFKCEDKHSICPYYIQKAEFMRARVGIANLSYVLYEKTFVHEAVAEGGRDLLIVDEGHRLEDTVMDFVSLRISLRVIKKLGLPAPSERIDSMSKLRKYMYVVMPCIHAMKESAQSGGGNQLTLSAGGDKSESDHIREISRIGKMMGAFKVIDAEEDTNWIVETQFDTITASPIWARKFIKPIVLNAGKRALLMSATLLEHRTACSIMGLDPDDTGWVDMRSSFPPENRPVNYWPVGRLSHKHGDIDGIITAIDQILEQHEGQKGIVHTVSYDLRDAILSRTRYPDRFVTHNARLGGPSCNTFDTLTNAVSHMMSEYSADDCVLISPSASLGLDLKDELGRFAVVVKVPFPNLGNKRVAIRKSSCPEWYSWQTAATVVQMTGRVVRDEADWGTSYILDENFGWFAKRYRALFPSWWKEACSTSRSIEGTRIPPQQSLGQRGLAAKI